MKTQVAIIGAGPSGLLLCRLLRLQGIETVVLERKDRAYVESRIRAGVLEQGTVDLFREAKVNDRMDREGIIHQGFSIAFAGRQERVDLSGHTDGKSVMVYGQTELTQDLYRVLLEEDDATIIFNAENVTPADYLDGKPTISYQKEGVNYEFECEYIAGCDGYHGASRASVPKDKIQCFEKAYPFGWLGLLSDTPPVDKELIYVNHQRGFALCSQRSLQRSRYYLQCELTDKAENWTAAQFWDELSRRIPQHNAAGLVTGPALEMSIAPLRSFVAEPMRFGKLFLVGDAAHIVPPTGAKGLNLAASDVFYLSRALIARYGENRVDLLVRYSETALRRVWQSVRFSWWFTSITHRFSDEPIEQRIQLAELDYLFGSVAGQTTIAENYVGLPFEDFS